LKTENQVIIVLSDGLGSGVKANILASLTTEILITMLSADSARGSIKTVIATLPTCQVRKDCLLHLYNSAHRSHHQPFPVINFDNPAPSTATMAINRHRSHGRPKKSSDAKFSPLKDI
jgi:hypothetical protein